MGPIGTRIVLCKSDLRDGRHQLLMAQCDDGALRLFLDNQPLPSVWPEDQLDACVDGFLALTREMKASPTPPVPADHQS